MPWAGTLIYRNQGRRRVVMNGGLPALIPEDL